MKYSIGRIGVGNSLIVSKIRNSVFAIILGLCAVSVVSAETIDTAVSYQQQGGEIRGRVVDVQNEPLIGVSIQVKGTTTGTVTDIDGNYSLQASQGTTLVFSYIGYATQEVTVRGQNLIVKLLEDTQALEEVVVVGYGTLKRREVTSSVETITAKDFNKVAANNALDLIQGKVAGLNMTRNQGSNPNEGMDIQLRGITSIEGSRNPLIVVDGIPDGSLDLISQDDIESFSVLKDGSAAAIYGTRANAGVILITTKKGKAGVAQFDYNTYMRHEVVTRKPDILSAADFRDLIKQGVIDESQDFGANTDLFTELLNQNNISQYHNFAMSGGSTNTNYRASVYFNDAMGIAKEQSRTQFGGRVNINQRGLKDRLMVSVNLATNFSKANRLGGTSNTDTFNKQGITDQQGALTGDFEQAMQRNPTAPLYNADGTFYETMAFNNYNPMSRLANRTKERNQQTTSADMRMKLDLVEGLSVSAFGSYMKDTYFDRYYSSLKDWDNREGTSRQGMGYAEKNSRSKWSQMFESTIDYRKEFSGGHTITGLLGYSYQYETWERTRMTNSGFTTDGFMDWNMGAGSAITNTSLDRPKLESEKKDNTLIAFFGRINYSYADKYHVQAVLRREGSSKFGANHKWGNFPALSAGWTVSEESFMENITAINELKLRVGYGVTGNQGIPEYQSMVTLTTGGVYPQNGIYLQTYGPGRNPNPELRWEQKKELNFGVDFTLLNRRITGSFDVFNRNTTDLLYSYTAQQPAYVQNSLYTNVGTMNSRGVELQLSISAIQKKDFSYGIDFTANTLDNTLSKLSSEQFKVNYLSFYGLPSPGNLGYAFRLFEGGSPGDFFGKRFAGLTEDGKWQFYKKDGTIGPASALSDNDQTIYGNGMPKFQLSLNNRFTYKNFDLTILFRGKFLFDILNLQELYFGNKKWLPNNLLKTAVTKHNRLNDDAQYSDYYLERGDFVKLDNLTLGYTIPVKTSYIRSLRVYATARNLLTFTAYSGVDPELPDVGFDVGVDKRNPYPRSTSLSFGLNVGF